MQLETGNKKTDIILVLADKVRIMSASFPVQWYAPLSSLQMLMSAYHSINI